MLELASGNNILIYGTIVSVISFFATLFGTPKIINLLISKGEIVQDYHKPEKPNVPRPAGPVLVIAIAAAEIVLYLLTFKIKVIAILLTAIIAFIVGFIDDRKVMPGWFKPIALIGAAIPLIVLGTHGSHLNLVFGRVDIPLLYLPLIMIIIPIAGNTINSIDVLNGVASGFVMITMIPLLVILAIFGSSEVFIASLPLLFATVAFYKYHKFPSRIFPGDSGALTLGAMYGVLAIVGHVEIIAAVALLPAVINSFLFLSSVKRIIEHRQIKSNPVTHTDDFKLMATTNKDAPVTLVRLILASGPMTEKQVGFVIFKLAIFSAVLAIVTAFMMNVKI